MIIKNKIIKVEDVNCDLSLEINGNQKIYEDAIFFDLEHYVYKKPICIGVFGSCYYDKDKSMLHVTQYMIENKMDANTIVRMASMYFKNKKEKLNKKYVVTFSGNNDFTVLKYLYEKKGIKHNVEEEFIHVDIQKQYEKFKKESIGLKQLEKDFDIKRESEVISGSNLAKTISKIIADDDYFKRMPEEKKNNILKYNQQDVVSLFYIMTNWKKYMKN